MAYLNGDLREKITGEVQSFAQYLAESSEMGLDDFIREETNHREGGIHRVLNSPRLDQIVCFAILMENHGGIIGKAPAYVMEKFWSCMTSECPESLLDTKNRRKFKEYMEIWCGFPKEEAAEA